MVVERRTGGSAQHWAITIRLGLRVKELPVRRVLWGSYVHLARGSGGFEVGIDFGFLFTPMRVF